MPPELPLRDIHLPAPVGGWPPAPGWWLLLLGLPLLAFALAWLWRFLRRQTPRKLALRELDALARSEADALEKTQQLAILLRRTALSLYPREAVAGLAGAEWLAFLDLAMQGRPFGEGAGRLLVEAPYRREAPAELDALVALCREWIKRQPKSRKAALRLLQSQTPPRPAPATPPPPQDPAPQDPRRFARPAADREESP